MKRVTFIRAAMVTALLASLTLISASPRLPFLKLDNPLLKIVRNSEDTSNPFDSAFIPDSLSSTSTYFRVRTDRRRCASPLCGGYFISRVNHPRTRCADGRQLAECYVAQIDWNGERQVDTNRALLRGNIANKRFQGFGNLGQFRVNESWQGASDTTAAGTFYRVKDRGLRCITFPCLTHHAAKLNSTTHRSIAGVDLQGVGAGDEAASKAAEQMTGPDGAIVAGVPGQVSGPGGKALQLKATQFYLRSMTPIVTKPCFKTGCSKQVCADEEVITTCEWREEYACYQKARCERQSDGSCGFTKTPELTACLRGK
ncbi:MAG: DUF6748 domain-containing protein [Pyrinomonadaceae bacterium]